MFVHSVTCDKVSFVVPLSKGGVRHFLDNDNWENVNVYTCL